MLSTYLKQLFDRSNCMMRQTMTFPLLHIIHVLLVSAWNDVMWITAAFIVTSMTSYTRTEFFSFQKLVCDTICKILLTLICEIRPSVLVESTCERPTYIDVTIHHVYLFEYVC